MIGELGWAFGAGMIFGIVLFVGLIIGIRKATARKHKGPCQLCGQPTIRKDQCIVCGIWAGVCCGYAVTWPKGTSSRGRAWYCRSCSSEGIMELSKGFGKKEKA